MKKLTIILVLTLILCTFITVPIASANANPAYVTGLKTYEKLTQFLNENPDRTAGKEGATKAAENLSNYFASLGLEAVGEGGLQHFDYLNDYSNSSETGQNVVYKLDSASEKKVIIGASYDNVTSLMVDGQTVGGEGAYGNGTGVAALMQLAEYFAEKTLPFDVEFVAFGAETVGSFGSKFYANVSAETQDNILLMINLNCVAGGENLYMYSEEVSTLHNKYFYQKADEKALGFTKVPNYRRQSHMFADTNSGLPMVHRGLFSDNAVFMKKGINTVSFLSINWEDKSNSSVLEYSGKQNVLNSTIDTLENLEKRVGGAGVLTKQLDSVVSSVIYALEGENFAEVMQESFDKKLKMGWLGGNVMSYISLCIKLIFVGLALFFSNKITKEYRQKYPFQPPTFTPVIINPFDELHEKPKTPFDELNEK